MMQPEIKAAQVAAVAELCPNLAGAVVLPSMQQTMLASLVFVQQSLEGLVRIRCQDQEWDDGDVDVDYAVDLALEHIKNLREELPSNRDVFDRKWFMAAAAVNLSVRAFSRTDCHYYRVLTGIKQKFEVLVAAVEFAELESRHGL